MGQMVSQEALSLQLFDQIVDEVFLIHTILARYDDIHISALLLTSPIGPADLNAVHIQRGDHSLYDIRDEFEHVCYLFPLDFLLELFIILKTYLLVAIEEIYSFAHVFDSLDA